MQSKAATVTEYLAGLPEDRREIVGAVRKVILANLDKNYTEKMSYGMIGYAVPHSIYPAGYHCDPKAPLPFVGLGSQKHHVSVYMMFLYGNEGAEARFRKEWEKTGKKLDMGKCCIRFRTLEDAALDVIGEAIKRMPAAKYIEHYEAALQGAGRGAGKGKKATVREAKPAPSPPPNPKVRPKSDKVRGGTKASAVPGAKSPARTGIKPAGRGAKRG
jgi:hypothetical protein